MVKEVAGQTLPGEKVSKLGGVLREPSPNPNHGKAGDELSVIQASDSYIYPVLLRQLKQDGRVSISQDDHRSLLANLEEKDWRYTGQDVEDAAKRLRKLGGCLP